MCFEVKDVPSVAKIAKQDISTFKILKRDKDGLLYSPLRDSPPWTPQVNTLATHITRVVTCPWNRFLGPGLHSIKTYKEAKVYRSQNCPKGSIIVEATIPAGSIYWENDTHYCSERLFINSGKPYRVPRVSKPVSKKPVKRKK